MLKLTSLAATTIAAEHDERALPGSGGVRIFPRKTKNERTVHALVVEFVAEPEVGDTIVRRDDAAVFLAEGVDALVGSRVLDAQRTPPSEGAPPQFVLLADDVS